ncbi:MAG TPA: hypothetical protein VK066_18150 [Chloroflexota bacterium]|nr:hypothetical protein [Chloroflexota bacterium]
MDRTAVGYFRDRGAADRAYDALRAAGYDKDDISIMGRGMEGRAGLADTDRDNVSAGQGAVTGGIFGLLLGAAAMLIPGIGPVVAVGPLAAGLAGVVTGGVTGAVVGGITGALVKAGVPEEEARWANERFAAGGYLVTVRTDEHGYGKARGVLEAAGGETSGENVQAVGRATVPPKTESAEDQRGMTGGIR